MKRTLIVAAVSALAAGSALAQSSVTVYGRANVTAESIDAGGLKTKQLVNNASRLGFRGIEDLGGGLKAGFNLEHGLSIDTGTPTATAFWNRRSEVNLSGGFGTLRMGRFLSEAYFATADYVSMHNHDTGNSADMLYAYVGRNTNKIAYRLPELVAGMSLEGSVSAAEGAAGQSRSYDLAWNYAVGALQLGAGYEKNGSAKQLAVRGFYDLGPLLLGAYVQKDTDGYGVGFGNRTTLRFSAAYNVGASEFHFNIGNAGSYSRVSNSKAKQFTLGYNYNLSKRTKVYGYYTKVDNNVVIYGPTTTKDFTSLAAGIRHNF